MHSRVVAAVLAVGVGLAGLLAFVVVLVSTQPSSFARAVELMPAGTLRATYTDWAQVRALADGADLDAGSSSREVDAFLSRAYDQDLTSTSAVGDAAYVMGRRYGLSALDSTWEMFGQSREGAVAVLQFGEDADLDGFERRLRTLGYEPPADGAGSGGVWAGSVDLLATIDVSLTPVLQNVVVLPQERLVLFSDSAAYAESSAAVVTGDVEPLPEGTDGVEALADAAGTPVSAVLFADDFACEALSMAAADDEDRALADQLVDDAGGVSPLAGLVLAAGADGRLTVGMHFENEDQAEADLRPRVDLASGEAVGQGGSFAERFRVAEARASGSEVLLDLVPREPGQPLLSDLSQGPVLFATC